MAFLLPSAGNLAQAAGLSDTKFGRGLIGFEAEKGKAVAQGRLIGVLVFTLLLGIVAVILLSTGVSDLETYGDYFDSTGHKVGLGFAGATLFMVFIAFWMLHGVTECAEDTLASETGQQQQQLLQPMQPEPIMAPQYAALEQPLQPEPIAAPQYAPQQQQPMLDPGFQQLPYDYY